jgi:hypothetical protein
MNNDLFKRVRNAIAHWTFVFERRRNRPRFVCFDDAGTETADIDVLEASALHAASLAIVQCVDQNVLRDERS